MNKPVNFLREDKLLCKITETVPYILQVIDLDRNRILYVNQEIYEVLGLNPDDIMAGNDSAFIIHPDDLPHYTQHLKSFKNCRDEGIRENKYRQKDASGRWRWMMSRDRVFKRSETGKPLQIMSCIQDITRQKENEDALKVSETLLREAQSIAHIGSFKLNFEEKNFLCSEQLYHIIEELPSQRAFDLEDFERLLHPEDQVRILHNLHTSIEKRLPFEFECRLSVSEQIKHILVKGKFIDEHDGMSMLGIVQDITRERETDRLLKDSQHFLKQVADTSPNIIFVYDVINQKYLYSNRQLISFTGLSEAELKKRGNLGSHIVHPDDLHIIARRERRFANLRDNEVMEDEFRVLNAQGEWHWLNSRAIVFKRDCEGRVWQILGNAQDITRQKETETAIIKSQYFTEQITNVTPGLITVYNVKSGQYIYVNGAITPLLGFSKGDLLEKGVSFVADRIHPDDLPGLMEENADALELANADPSFKDIITFEYRVKDIKGQWKWLHTSGTIFDRADNGTVEHVLNVSIDITERKQAEEKLLRNEAILSEAQQLVKLGTWEWDLQDDVVTWSDELFNMFGYQGSRKGNLSFSAFLQHIHPDDKEYVNSVISASLRSHAPFSFEHRVITLSGEERIFQGKGKVIVYDGKVVKMFGTTMDITERKQTEQEVQRINIEVETQKRLNEKKDEFIGIASHELKTPLTSIKAYVQLLEQEVAPISDNCTLMKYLEKANLHIQRLNGLITDLLDVSKIQSGKLQFNISSFDLHELVAESIENMQLSSPRHRIEYSCKCSCVVNGDRQRLEQVLINILSNAIKYSPQADKVFVELQTTPKNVVISVTDHGIGILQENIPRIFERFYRVEGLSTQFSGLGIGLFISNEIVKRHNGKIEVNSIPCEGSTFKVILPLGK